MPVLILYLFKLTLSLAVVFLFYHFVLRRLTFYNWNRFYLVAYTVLSFLIPFINITPVLERNEMMNSPAVQFIPSVNAFTNTNDVVTVHASSVNLSSWDWMILFFAAGVLVLAGRMLMQLFSFRKIVKKSILISSDSVKLYQVDQSIIPFSFGNSIFINKQQHCEQELQEIIRHEFVHIRQKHTVDIIWSEILCILNWYNPFVWLIRRAIRQNLEFIADDKVLQSGIDKKQYQYLLLKVTGNNYFSIASQFNFSSLKKRIAMMNKMKSAKAHLVKFLFIVPLFAVVLVAFRDKTIDHERQINTAGNNREGHIKTAPGVKIPEKKIAGILYDTIPGNQIKTSASEKDFLKRHPDINNIRWVAKESTSNLSGNANPVIAGDVFIIIQRPTKKPEVYNLSTSDDLKRFKNNYGEAPPEPPAEIQIVDSIEADGTVSNLVSKKGDRKFFNYDKQPLIILDGVEQPENTDPNTLLQPVEIAEMTVLKDEEAIATYGNKAKNGVIALTSRAHAAGPVTALVSATVTTAVIEKPVAVTSVGTTISASAGKPSAVSVTKAVVAAPEKNTVSSVYVSPLQSTSATAGKPVQTTTELKSPVSVTVNQTATESVTTVKEIRKEKSILAVIKSNSTEADIKKIESDLKTKGYDFKINKVEFKDGKLVLVNGTISKNSQKQYFTASDFAKLVIADVPEDDKDNRFNFMVLSGSLNVSDKVQ